MQDVESGQPSLIRWDSRELYDERFRPSRRMTARALTEKKSLLQIWSHEEEFNAPIHPVFPNWISRSACRSPTTPFPAGAMHSSGESSEEITSNDLKGDLKFMVLMAQFIDSVRQVRRLEKSQANLSQFFSAHVLETLTDESAEILLKPKESDITVIFCDVRGFSKMTERANDDLLPLLDRVIEALSAMTRQIVKYDGIISDFQGDAALGFWGWPVALDRRSFAGLPGGGSPSNRFSAKCRRYRSIRWPAFVWASVSDMGAPWPAESAPTSRSKSVYSAPPSIWDRARKLDQRTAGPRF